MHCLSLRVSGTYRFRFWLNFVQRLPASHRYSPAGIRTNQKCPQKRVFSSFTIAELSMKSARSRTQIKFGVQNREENCGFGSKWIWIAPKFGTHVSLSYRCTIVTSVCHREQETVALMIDCPPYWVKHRSHQDQRKEEERIVLPQRYRWRRFFNSIPINFKL